MMKDKRLYPICSIMAAVMFVLSFVCCSSQKKIASQNSVERIEFGSGGGYSGAVKTYTLFRDGTYVMDNGEKKTVDEAVAQPIFQKATTFTSAYMRPGNTYNFVRIITAQGEYYYCWEFGDKKIDKNIVELYKQLRSL